MAHRMRREKFSQKPTDEPLSRVRSGHGFGHSSVTVLVTILNLPQSLSITMPRHLTR